LCYELIQALCQALQASVSLGMWIYQGNQCFGVSNEIFWLQDPYPTRSIESLDLMESMFLWLLRYGGKQDVAAEQKLVNERPQVSSQLPDDSASSPQKGSPVRAEGRADPGTPGSISGGVSGFTGSDAQPQVLVSELWLSVLQAFTRISLEANEHLRNHAVVILHR